LCDALGGWLVPALPPLGAAMPFTDALAAGIEEVHRLLAASMTAEARRAVGQLRMME
jgi:hypothetical protein